MEGEQQKDKRAERKLGIYIEHEKGNLWLIRKMGEAQLEKDNDR